jgi:uncharacterized protein DUF6496
MAVHQSKVQQETVGRVMHEFKHGELETSRGKKVTNPKQAIAIRLHEAGASKYESKEKNRENLRRTKARTARRNEKRPQRAPSGGRVIRVPTGSASIACLTYPNPQPPQPFTSSWRERDRKFESRSLQRRVINEPESAPAGAASSYVQTQNLPFGSVQPPGCRL